MHNTFKNYKEKKEKKKRKKKKHGEDDTVDEGGAKPKKGKRPT